MEDDFDINKMVDEWFDRLPLIDTNINSQETYDNIQEEESKSEGLRKTSSVRPFDDTV